MRARNLMIAVGGACAAALGTKAAAPWVIARRSDGLDLRTALRSQALHALLKWPVARTKVVRTSTSVVLPDGETLAVARWHPVSEERAPILLVRTPYGTARPSALLFRVMAEAGYQVVAVECRGTFGSTGEWIPFRNEAADGAAVLDWLPRQPWFVEDVITTGASYFGLTQWAIAADPPPWLKGMVLGVTSSSFQHLIYPGGAFALETALSWAAAVEHQEDSGLIGAATRALLGRKKLAAAALTIPLGDSDIAAVGHTVGWYQDWLAHDDPADPWWTDIDFSAARSTMPPTTMIAGWYDIFVREQLDDFTEMRAAGRQGRLIVGPWTHGSLQSVAALVDETIALADERLRGKTVDRGPDVQVFDLGTEEWRHLEAWPPESETTRYHLHAGSRLDPAQPAPGAPDRYRYDPHDPTPSVGGTTLTDNSGPKDNRTREARPDVVTFTTAALKAPLTVMGDVQAELWFRSSLEHTDLFVRLCDVHPDGTSRNISDGIVRLPIHPADIQPDGTLCVRIRMAPTVTTFQPGHAIRLQVSSGAHPIYARNPGTGEPIAGATRFEVAEQEIFHDPSHPSAVLLSVVGDG